MTVALRVGNEGREIRALSQITWTLRKPPADSCAWVASEFRYHWKLVPMNIGGDEPLYPQRLRIDQLCIVEAGSGASRYRL